MKLKTARMNPDTKKIEVIERDVIPETAGEALRMVRAHVADMTLGQCARRLGVSVVQLSQWERGR